MPLVVTLTLGIVIVVLPMVLAMMFHGSNLTDARGRRLNTQWSGTSLVVNTGTSTNPAVMTTSVEPEEKPDKPSLEEE